MSDTPPIPAGATKRADPESFRARGLSASLSVNDIQKSLTWYTEVAGFTVDRKHERDGKLVAVSLKAGDARLMIGQDDGAKGWDRVKGDGFSLYFTTVQDIDAIAQRIRKHGGKIESEPTDMPWGARVFRLQDPDGFKLVISKEPVAG
jgi:uncharacterized glyoxalase superfamily protein PhnB